MRASQKPLHILSWLITRQCGSHRYCGYDKKWHVGMFFMVRDMRVRRVGALDASFGSSSWFSARLETGGCCRQAPNGITIIPIMFKVQMHFIR